MKLRTLTAFFLLATTYSHAQDFEHVARSKDSLMHIAYYDNDITGYNKYFTELKTAYSKLSPKDKSEYKSYIEEEYYYLAKAYAKKGNINAALTNLEQSKYYRYQELVDDHDLDVLRKEPRFVKYLNIAKNQNSYIVKLQKEQYNIAEQQSLPAFTYQSANSPKLKELSAKFKLDSIAGNGNDVSQIINLMKWVHYSIPHNGGEGNPEVKNTNNFIKEHNASKRTLNCRGLAIMLNEVYLAAGFKSRYVTCLPKDTSDNDCHVINMVWSSSLKKWLWMDPTFMAYVMNEAGELLSIEEVRERLVKGKPIILNPDANRNHATSQTKEDYLEYYMAKNLYKLECPVSSEYNYETRETGKAVTYVQLLPGTTAAKTDLEKNKHGISSYSLYHTNNPKTFWTAPVEETKQGKAASAHTQSDYEQAFNKFMKSYNAKNAAGINDTKIKPFRTWTDEVVNEIHAEYGKMISYKFIGMEIDNQYEDVALFMVTCERSTHCTALSLNEENLIGTFRFKTYSNYIDWALAKAIDKERSSK